MRRSGRAPLLAACLLLACSHADEGPAQAELFDLHEIDSEPLMPVGEILERLEASVIAYDVTSVPTLPWKERLRIRRALWPRVAHPLHLPHRSGSEEEMGTVEETPLPGEVEDAIGRVKEPLSEERFAEAEARLAEAVERHPSSYILRVLLGTAASRREEADRALSHFRAARELNRVDTLSYYLEGLTLLALGRDGEALQSLAWAIALRPGDPEVIVPVGSLLSGAGYGIASDLLWPGGYARKVDEARIEVVFAEDAPHWLSFAACKGLWMGDADHRERLLGDREHRLSMAEELECTTALVTGYRSLRDRGSTPKDAAVEKIGALLDDGHLETFLFYEVAGRVAPDLIASLPLERREAIQRYVLERVIVSESQHRPPAFLWEDERLTLRRPTGSGVRTASSATAAPE